MKKRYLILCLIVLLIIICFIVLEGKDFMNHKKVYSVNGDKVTISYQNDSYIVTDPKTKLTSNNYRNVLSIKGKKQKIYDKIVKHINDINDNRWKYIKENQDSSVKDVYRDTEVNLDYNYEFKTGVVNDNRITIKSISTGNLGILALPSDKGYNFDLVTGELLTLDSISNDGKSLREFINKMVNYKLSLYKEEDHCVNQIGEDGVDLDEVINTEGNWYFTSNGIKVSFSEYSVVCDNDGMYNMVFYSDIVNKYLKDKYKI